MRRQRSSNENGSTLIMALGVIVILSLVGANVLINCTTRYNASAKQVKAWKESLYAAEAGGDIGYAKCRELIGVAGGALTPGNGWTSAGTNTIAKTFENFGQDNSLSTNVTVEKFHTDPISGNASYRIRSTGSSKVLGLPRVSMDNRMSTTTEGDSLLRKIDFKFDHFLTTYGFGDALPSAAPTSANGKTQDAVVAKPKISRRIELVAVPVEPFEGALKALGSFDGPGSAGRVDSYDSNNPINNATTGSYYPTAATTPSHPYYADSRNGNVAVNTPSFRQGGPIYGDVGTNGGTVTRSNTNISGTIDNNVSFTARSVPPQTAPAGNPYKSGTPDTIIPSATAHDPAVPDYYLYNSYHGKSINALATPAGAVLANGTAIPAGQPVETYVTVVVNGDVGDITIAKGVNAKFYFNGNLNAKASDLINNNVDQGAGVYKRVLNTTTGQPLNYNNDPAKPVYALTTNTSRAGHFQLYGVKPASGTQTININPGGSVKEFWGTIYAPDANVTIHGNPDFYGAIVCKSFSGNGNTGFHYDKALKGNAGPPVEFRIASYVEDIR